MNSNVKIMITRLRKAANALEDLFAENSEAAADEIRKAIKTRKPRRKVSPKAREAMRRGMKRYWRKRHASLKAVAA